MKNRVARIPLLALGAAAIALATSGASHAEWDIGSYDNCVTAAGNRAVQNNSPNYGTQNSQLADDLRFCCDRSGGQWSQGSCGAPPAAAQTDAQGPTLPPVVTSGGTVVTRPGKASAQP
jgi:hypothetical protein